MSIRHPVVACLAAAFLTVSAAGTAFAAKGHITDPSGDFPDITRLDYDNAQTKVVLKLTYSSLADAQNQSFYLQWGAPKKYQVFYSPGVAIKDLRFYTDADTFRTVDCAGLRVVEDADTESTRAVIPRSCIKKAPDALRFKGIATQGTSLSDETKLTPKADRG